MQNNDLISRNALMESLCSVSAPTPDESYIVEKCINKVNDAPAVEAVALPCKIGDTLYDIYEAVNNGGDEIREYKVSIIQIQIRKNGRAWLIVDNIIFSLDDFGKTAFLTREEAEAALAERTKRDERL